MSSNQSRNLKGVVILFLVLFFTCFVQAQAQALTVNVVGCDENNTCSTPLTGFRWLVEEDTTTQSPPGVRVPDSISLVVHNSYAPVVATDHATGSSAEIVLPKKMSSKRLYVSVLPDSGYTASGVQVEAGQAAVTVKVHKLPIPTAQISVLVFKDHNPINNIYDTGEELLEGWNILVFDQAGPMSKDIFGNPLGTTYAFNPDGTAQIDPSTGEPVVAVMGDSIIRTGTDGTVLIKILRRASTASGLYRRAEKTLQTGSRQRPLRELPALMRG